ncbi:MAG: DUF6100 family protein [Eubacteriales bacterium]|nr:DUF6100 family protein [Eubacteriales bacterium]
MSDTLSSDFTAALQKTNDIAARLAAGRYDDEYLYHLTSAAQQTALAARQLYTQTKARSGDFRSCGKSPERANPIADGYSLQMTRATVVIRLPLLLTKRGCDSAFICEPLDALLSAHAPDLPRFRECTVEFLHCYAASHRPADVRDHDNLETRAVLNTIERYLLTSDSGLYCTNIQSTCWAPHDGTVVTLRPGKIPVMEAVP